MKKTYLGFISLMVSLIISLSVFSVRCVSAESFGFYGVSNQAVDHTLEDSELEPNWIGSCTHYGSSYVRNLTVVAGVARFDICVCHGKEGFNNCRDLMHWTIEFVSYLPGLGAQVIKPHIRSGQMFPNASPNVEAFRCPSEEIFKYRLITIVAGVRQSTGWIEIKFT